MKALLLTSTGALFVSMMACSPGSTPATTGTGGSASGTGGSSTGSGGTSSGTGGSSSGSGGSVNTGGSGPGTGGSSNGTGGDANTGGSGPGTGGTMTGSGGSGTGTGGSMTGTGGAMTGTGGVGGRANTGGATGTGGAGGGAGGDLSVVGAWDGALVAYPCASVGSGYDCPNTMCTNNTATKMTVWNIGGTAGTVYNVTFRVRGIVEAYNYSGGTRDAGNASITNNLDLFLQGGMQLAAGATGGDYNTYQLLVAPAVTGKPNTYALNSVSNAENPHASGSPTTHLTFPIDYTKTISVTGGGTVTLRVYDSNCTQVKNCGPTSGNTCAAPRTVSLAGAMPAAPSTFMQPYQMPSGGYGQWVFFDITNVTVGP